ncbi:DUF3306 domain-containing protein [Shewanella canadensis]|uniref:DUF3306 domain-containing protein n=1 Tax=Shewanella canadensis TaxID=271096 RepID=A0A3S0J3Q4_9GAMM|nr:DUF3306 domain-containing protein [Shewanella canadensis]RTR37323.1 DUF3306 domain-containing protein [Shewanella canadensis]
MSDKPSGLLSRWNLRRQQVADEQEAEKKALETAEQAEASIQETSLEGSSFQDASTEASAESQAEDKILSAEELPDPEKIEVGGSFASFMADNVDPTAKAAALKALWKQPQYSEIDGLLEYALDYSNQPKLTPEHSAEIAKKIFRHVTKDKEEEQEGEETLTAKLDTQAEEIAAHSGEEVSGDILDVQSDDLTQNEPQKQDESKVTVS